MRVSSPSFQKNKAQRWTIRPWWPFTKGVASLNIYPIPNSQLPHSQRLLYIINIECVRPRPGFVINKKCSISYISNVNTSLRVTCYIFSPRLLLLFTLTKRLCSLDSFICFQFSSPSESHFLPNAAWNPWSIPWIPVSLALSTPSHSCFSFLLCLVTI